MKKAAPVQPDQGYLSTEGEHLSRKRDRCPSLPPGSILERSASETTTDSTRNPLGSAAKPGAAIQVYQDSATEAEIQKAIVEGLGYLGYTVLETTERRKRMVCEHRAAGASCGGSLVCTRCARTARYSHQGSGVHRGVPDLIVTRSKPLAWAEGVWLGLEVKAKGGVLSIEQQELRDAGRIYVVRSFEEARDAIEAFEGRMWR